jgi:hypothetical protein
MNGRERTLKVESQEKAGFAYIWQSQVGSYAKNICKINK